MPHVSAFRYGLYPMINESKAPVSAAAVATAKLVGLLAGAVCASALQLAGEPPGPAASAGLILWYACIGAMAAACGCFKSYPAINVRIRWWMAGTIVGAWMNFVLALILGAAAERLSVSAAIRSEGDSMWLVADGALIGLIAAGAAEAAARLQRKGKSANGQT